MSTAQLSGRPLLLNPHDREHLDALDVEVVAASAKEWLRRGGTARALALYRTILERDPRHVEALTAVAAATLAQDLDTADDLYRRADATGGLPPEEYVRWILALAKAAPPRARQAADIARRLRDRFPDRPDFGAWAALWLAESGDLASADAAVRSLAGREDLDDDTSSILVRVVGLLLGGHGPWAGHYERARDVIRELTRSSGRSTLLEAARVGLQQGDLAGAKEYLDRLDREARSAGHPVATEATLLRALIAADYEQFDEAVHLLDTMSEVTDEVRLVQVFALHGAGHLEEAAGKCTKVIDSIMSSGEQDRSDHRVVLVRALLLRAVVSYDLGDFPGCWDAVREAVTHRDEHLPANVSAVVLSNFCRTRPWDADGALRALDKVRQRDAALDASERQEIELTWVETLVWLADHDDRYRAQAEVAAREALARVRQQGGGVASTLRAAYLALLAEDDEVARALLQAIPPEESGSWRILALQAMAALRAQQPDDALELSRRVVEHRRHDLDMRCALVQAALSAGNTTLATREAAAIVRFAPGHVHARLLLAECFFLGLRSASKGRSEDFQQLVYATREYAEAVRLHQGLEAFLRGNPVAAAVGSQLLSAEALSHAARRGAHAAVRAGDALARSGLPADKTVLQDGRLLIDRLHRVDPQEADRLSHLLKSPARERKWRWLQRGGLPVVAVILLALTQAPFIDEYLGAGGEPRLVLAALAALALFWPYIRKVNVLGVEVERAEAAARLGTSEAILHEGLVGAQRGVSRLLLPTPPPGNLPTGSSSAEEREPAAPRGGVKEAERGTQANRRPDPKAALAELSVGGR